MNRSKDRNCTAAGKKHILGTSVLGTFIAVLLIASGFLSVCAQAKTTTPTTKVIKTSSEDDFAVETSKLVKKNKGRMNAKGQVEAYSSGRLIVRVKDGKKANLTSYGASTIIQSNFGVNIVQFSSSGAAKNAAKKMAKLSAVLYAEADDASLNVGDTTSQISFEGASESEDISDSGVTGTDNILFRENPSFTGNIDPTASGYDRNEQGKDTTYDATIKAGAAAVSSTAMSWGVSYLRCDKYAAYVKKKTSRSIKVAIIDSGVSDHSKLEGRLMTGMDFIDNDYDASDENGHGTHVAGTVVDCTKGLNVYILPVRVMDGSGMGSPSVVGNGIRYAVARGAKVINLSLGGDSHYSYLEECITWAYNKGVTVVIAAGNENENTKYTCPAHMSSPIVVSAIDKNGKRAYFSNYGASIDVAAPGIDVVSCGMDGGYAIASGTSMASPHISAVAAMFRLLRPDASAKKIHSLVRYYTKDYGAKGKDNYYGAGVPYLTYAIFPIKVTLSKTSLTLQVKKTYTLKSTITPSYAGAKRKITWSSSNSKIVSVSGGKLTAKAKGTATITAKTANNRKATCKVTVTGIKPTSIKLSATTKNMKVGGTAKLTATVLPSNAENKKVTWTTSNAKIATVSGGKVTAKAKGTATITAKTVNGKKATCKITVTAVTPTSIKLTATTRKLKVGGTYKLTATVLPTNATNKKVTWTTNNSKVATVSGGKVTAKAKGTATITAKTVNGKKATCKIIVTAVTPTSVTLNAASKKLTVGNTTQLTATVLPSNATNKSVTWTTSNSAVATVSAGKVTAKKAGTAKITAATTNGKTTTCSITVVNGTVSASSVKVSAVSSPAALDSVSSSAGSGAVSDEQMLTATEEETVTAQQAASASEEEETSQQETSQQAVSAEAEEEAAQLTASESAYEETAEENLTAASDEELVEENLIAETEEGTVEEDLTAVSDEELSEGDLTAVTEEETVEELTAVTEEKTLEDLTAVTEEETLEDLPAVSDEEMAGGDLTAVTEEETEEDLPAVSDEELSEGNLTAVTEEGTLEDLPAVSDEELSEGDLTAVTEEETVQEDLIRGSIGNVEQEDLSQESIEVIPVDGESQETAQDTPLSDEGKDFSFPFSFIDIILP